MFHIEDLGTTKGGVDCTPWLIAETPLYFTNSAGSRLATNCRDSIRVISLNNAVVCVGGIPPVIREAPDARSDERYDSNLR